MTAVPGFQHVMDKIAEDKKKEEKKQNEENDGNDGNEERANEGEEEAGAEADALR